MPKKATPVPIQLRARSVGCIQWMCPNCSWMSGTVHTPYRRAKLQCYRCHKNYRLGLKFHSYVGAMPPFAAVHMGKFNGHTANIMTDSPHEIMVGRVYGLCEFECPVCYKVQAQQIDWDTAMIGCDSCESHWMVSLIIYNSIQHTPTMTPKDWVLNVQKPQATDGQQLPAAEVGTS